MLSNSNRDGQDEWIEIIKRVHEDQMQLARAENVELRKLLLSQRTKPIIIDPSLQSELDAFKQKYFMAVKELELKEAEFKNSVGQITTLHKIEIEQLEDKFDQEREAFRQEKLQLKRKYEKEIEEVRDKYDQQIIDFKMEKLEIESNKNLFSELSSPDESHASEFSVKVSELNDKFVNIAQLYEEAMRTINKLKWELVKQQADHKEELTVKEKVVKKLEKRIVDITKRLENQEKKNKQICTLQSKLLKLESSKRKVEDDYKKLESNLENEKTNKRKRKIKDKTENQKNNETVSRLTKNIENLHKKIRELENANIRHSMPQQFKPEQLKDRKSNIIKTSRNTPFMTQSKGNLNHSQSNDALLRDKNNHLAKSMNQKHKLRDFSSNSKKSTVPQLNLSEITNGGPCGSGGSPMSTYRIFNPLNNSQKRAKQTTNTSTSNLSFCNSVNGIFRNSVVGGVGDGSSKYCAAWKYKEWKKTLNYDIEEFLKNRDMIRTITCLGCSINFEVKFFLEHVKRCRMCYNIPYMVSTSYQTERKVSKSPQNSLNMSKSSSIFKNSMALSPKNE